MLRVTQMAGFGSGDNGPAPTVATTNTGSAISATSYAAPLPASIAAGDMLLILVANQNGTGATTISVPSGWTSLFNAAGTGTLRAVAAFWKIADGSEGSTVTVSTSTSSIWATNSYRITGHRNRIVRGTSATGTSTSADPPSVSPTWAKSSLFIALVATTSEGTAPSSPTNYGNQLNGAQGAGGGVRMCSARRTAQTSAEDPSAFGLSSSLTYLTFAIAIA